MYDLKITGGRLYLDGAWAERNLYVAGEKIARISEADFESREVIDAAGSFVLPGLIDGHVHLSGPGNRVSADNFFSGSRAAVMGGVTTMIDFLGEARLPDEVERFFDRRMAEARDSIIDYAFHCSVRQPEKIPAMARASLFLGMPTWKLYTTYREAGIYTDDRHIDEVLRRTAEGDLMVLCHTENDTLTESAPGPLNAFGDRRPVLCELSEAIKLAQMTAYRQGLLYMVHVSCGTTVQELKKRFPELLNKRFILESCPHYFLFDDSVYAGEKGRLYTMTPPLRSPAERAALLEHIDDIRTIGTDHCPFMSSEKQGSLASIPMGVNGLGNAFAQMYGLFGDQIIDQFTVQPAKVHGLYPRKGVLREGADADVALFEKIPPRDGGSLYGLSDYSIYAGCPEAIRFHTVISRGLPILLHGALLPRKGHGAYVRRRLDSIDTTEKGGKNERM